MSRRALLADLDRCTGCCSCIVACKEEHKLPAGMSFMRLEQVGPDEGLPELNMYFLPLACQQCDRPGCAASCREGAIARSETGLVHVDAARCTGCGDCVAGCPYAAMSIDPACHLARKCELCSDSVPAGCPPVCVASCPVRALSVIDLDAATADSAPAEPAMTAPPSVVHVLKESAGTVPAGRFVLSRQEWHDVE